MEENKDAQKPRRPSSLRKRSSGFFRRSSRNSLSGDRGLDSRSGPTSPTLDFLPSVDTTLTQDKSLSRFFAKTKTTPIAENPGEPIKTAPAPTQPSNASLYSHSATMLSRRSNDTGATSDYQYQSTILTLQTKIMTESQERESIQAKYSTLAKLHEAQRSELASLKLGKKPAVASASAVSPDAVSSPPQPASATADGVAAPGEATAVPNAESDLHQKLGDILTQLHDWVFTNFNDSKINLGKLTKEDKAIVERVMSSSVSIKEVPKTAILQALATSSFLNVFQDPFFPGLPSKFDGLKNSCELLKKTTPTKAYMQWRASTVSTLLASNDAAIKQGADDLAKQVVTGTDAAMARLASAKKADARQQKLKTIVESAIDLARQLRAQSADFGFDLPIDSTKKSAAFDETLMDDVTGATASAQAKTVQVVLSPVVYRLSVEGSKAVALKSRVVCTA